jgi:predicted nucleic acid-binding protein
VIYLDTSCLLKVVRIEDASNAVGSAIDREREVIVSALAELEALVQLKARYLAGEYTLPGLRRLEFQLHALRHEEPFVFRNVPVTGVWDTAFRQHRNSGKTICHTLDRLHLAIAESLGVTRIMTHDIAQAKAAEELGFEVVQPR